MKIHTLFIYVIISFASIILTKAADTASVSDIGDKPAATIQFDFDAYAKMSDADLDRSLLQFDADFAKTQQLVDQAIQNTHRKQAQIAAIFIAGELRMGVCARTLSRMKDFTGNHKLDLSSGSGFPPSQYPVGEAIQKMGDVITIPFLEEIAATNDVSLKDFALGWLQEYQRNESLSSDIQGMIATEQQFGKTEGVARLKAAEPLILNPPPSLRTEGTSSTVTVKAPPPSDSKP